MDNSGNVTLSGVAVTDQVESSGVTYATLVSGDTNGDGKLDVTETWTYSASYVLTQADLDGRGGGDGDLDNTATADTNETSPKSADFAVPLVYNPDLTITKTGTVADGSANAEGDVINYSIVVDNSGNVTLSGVAVTDQVESSGATNATLVSGDINGDGSSTSTRPGSTPPATC